MDLYGQFLYSEPKTDARYFDIASGNFALLSSLLLYSGQYNLGTSAASAAAHAGQRGRGNPALRTAAHHRIVHHRPLRTTPASARSPSRFLTSRRRVDLPDAGSALSTPQAVNYNRQQVEAILRCDLQDHPARRLPLRVGRCHRARRRARPERTSGLRRN